MVCPYYFTPSRLRAQRREIEHDGLAADPFLANDANCPVFGLNLTCAFPFPPSARRSYSDLARQLARLSKNLYVYPLWETHVTVVTFVNFSLFRRPSAPQLAELLSWVAPTIDVVRPLFEKQGVAPFELEFRQPILTRKAIILPIANPGGEMAAIRRRVSQLLAGNQGLREKLRENGLNFPGIIHSTIARWKKTPRNARAAIARFDAIAKAAPPFSIRVEEMLFTTELKPYMRGSKILHRFALREGGKP